MCGCIRILFLDVFYVSIESYGRTQTPPLTLTPTPTPTPTHRPFD